MVRQRFMSASTLFNRVKGWEKAKVCPIHCTCQQASRCCRHLWAFPVWHCLALLLLRPAACPATSCSRHQALAVAHHSLPVRHQLLKHHPGR
jgi:hypothetical protein